VHWFTPRLRERSETSPSNSRQHSPRSTSREGSQERV
jgi:hypothetical protein